MLFALTFTKGCESRTRFFLLTFRHTLTAVRRGVVDVRGRADFSRFDPRPERPHFSNFGPPAERRPFCGAKTFL